jgi:hypothetical protein
MQSEIQQGYFPQEIKLCINIIIDKTIRSLGWDKPIFKLLNQ